MSKTRFEEAIRLFDVYNGNDPKIIHINGRDFPENVLYGWRMSEKLIEFEPDVSEPLRLAVRSQHIGRWEIPRSDFPMDRKGYLQWRSQLKLHHAKIASRILEDLGYNSEVIYKVKDMLMKKNLKQDRETQILEDVICLVFLEFYFDDFSNAHHEDKLVNILKKTIAKMSARGVEEALKLPLSDKAKALISKASYGNN
jgi:hypothetical protein